MINLDTIFGLPIHPLVVHAAVVLLPLTALGAIALVVKEGWRDRYLSLLALLSMAAAGAAVVASSSGEALQERLQIAVGDHGEWGDRVGPVAALLSAAIIGMWLVDHNKLDTKFDRWARIGAVALALVSLGLVTAVGHSGATLVWQDAIAATSGR